MNKLQDFLQEHVGPIAEKLNGSVVIKTITMGMMASMPITLGVAILAVLIYLPITPLQAFLQGTGLSAMGLQVLTVTMSMLAPYQVICLARAYATIKKTSVINSILVALGFFFILVPLGTIEGTRTYTITTTYLGSNGIFLGMIIGILIPFLYEKLMPHVGIKLPDTIPPMVTDSLSPTFCAMILFTVAYFTKWGFSLTAYGNIFDFFNNVIAAPIMSLGASPITLIVVYTLASILWFFGIHPSALLGAYSAPLGVAQAANAAAFLAGEALPYLKFQLIYIVLDIGGTGVMIGLALCMLLFAKSDRYKALAKLGGIPSFFNISEPIMFGFPVVMNTNFFIPMLLATPVCGIAAWVLSSFGLGASLNPAAYMPWVLPKPISGFLQGGFGLLIIVLAVMAIATLIYYPFFKMADNQAVKEEKEAVAAK